MAIAKLFFLLVVSIAQLYATTPPNVRPPSDELREQRGSERAIPYIIAINGTLIWSWAFLEGLVLFALSDNCPPGLARPLLHVLLPALDPTTTTTTITTTTLTTLMPTFFTGALLTLFGALLRAHCFHTLGSRFTFELSIRGPSHTLVTDGVHGVVRHPSYTGAVVIGVGWLLCLLDPRGWVVGVCTGGWVPVQTSNSNGGGNGGRGAVMTLTAVWAALLGMIYVMFNERMKKEDAMLEENFGEVWRAWQKRVPYRLLPGVY